MFFIKDEIYWIWLQEALRRGSSKVRTVLKLYKDAKDFYLAGEKQWRLCGCFTNKEIELFKKHTLKEADDILRECYSSGIDVITLNDPRYPERLKTIVNLPCVLYVKGRWPNIDERITIGVVGTRSATAYGLQMAYDLSYSLAKLSTIIVSGGAIGIDTYAHKGALNAAGDTILVLGCGHNCEYLKENRSLRKEVASNGVLISEYHPSCPAYSSNFPLRNRLISGLSLGILVVEAGQKSGSLITADLALKQNRDVFAVPGNINSSVSCGTNNLIKEGAKPVTCAKDIIEEYTHLFVEIKYDSEPENSSQESTEVVLDENFKKDLSDDAIKVYEVLTLDPKNVDELSIETDFKIGKLLQILTELELHGLVESQSGRRYSKIRGYG